ncbi:neprilysin-2-like isoform X1 [Microplitis mediator]|uniref:neprilysin-2-like isoform X1 n=1 Tax=Microplitis mediator TaxID=375433 RepID=UPI0025567A78|nr:neprilysin-2-like isoform X1 [Microplitis mediator]
MYRIFNKTGRSRVSLLDRPLFLIVTVGFIWSLISINDASVIDTARNNVVTNKCMSTACSVERSETAARIIRYRDDTINPCNNFYRFACGNYKKTDKSNDYDHLMSQKIVHFEKQIKEGISSDFEPYKLIDDIYKICMNKEARGQQGLDLMKRIIKTLGNWPILEADNWKESEFDWIDFSGNAKKVGYGINYFLDWHSFFTFRNNKYGLRYAVTMNPYYFDLSMGTETIEKKEMYADYMLEIARSLGANNGEVIQQLKEAFEFENKFNEIISRDISSDMNDNITGVDINIQGLQKQWPSIDWKRFIDKSLIPFVDKNEEPILTVKSSTILTEFTKLMEKTPKRVQANYAIWKLVQYSVPYLTEEFRKAQEKFYKQVGYVGIPTDDYCMQRVESAARFAYVQYYLDQHKSSRETIKQMTMAFSDRIIRMINESKIWCQKAKIQSIEIIKKMPFTIGLSEKFSDPKELKKYYADAQVVENNSLQTLLNLNVFEFKKYLSVKANLDIIPYDLFPQSKVGLPDYIDGQLLISTTMIDSPLFNYNRPMYMNFGSSGTYLASNIASDIFYVGMNYLVGKEQLDCFRHQIDDLTDEAMKENMLRDRFDVELVTKYIGFRTSWAAYQDYVARSGTEPTLGGYTQSQLFWISYAQSFCSEYLNVNEPRNIYYNQLNILEYKMMKILSNIPEISADFQCPVGSNLNQEPKCTWW